MSPTKETNPVIFNNESPQHTSTDKDELLVNDTKIHILHEVTLQDLPCTRNHAIQHLLYECNELPREQ
jgi:hypothetical protein